VLGASDDPREREESLALGANGWMRRPDGAAERVAALSSFAAFWLLANTPPRDA
jgi:hypothetical protein